MTDCTSCLPEGHHRLQSGVGGRLLSNLQPPAKHAVWSEVVFPLAELIGKLAKGEEPWPLLLFGEPGSGKTCAGLCMLDLFGGVYTGTQELCDLLIRATNGELSWTSGYRRTAYEVWQMWEREESVCVLDELGARDRVSEFANETVKRAIDSREGRPAVFISNHDLEGLARSYDDRIASRLAGGSIMKLEKDRRIARRFSQVDAV